MPRIAIIEDDAALRSTLHLALAEEGYDAVLVVGPGDLLAQLTAGKPDLVLLDLMLGTWGDGLALAGAIRGEPGWEQAPIIVVSAAQDLLRRYAQELANLRCRVVEKPFDLDHLLALIVAELGGSAQQ